MEKFDGKAFIESLAKSHAESDYLKDEDEIRDGIHYCRVCGEAKQSLEDFGTEIGELLMNIACACEVRRKEAEEKHFRMRQEADRQERVRNIGLRHKSLIDSRFEVDDGQNAGATKVMRQYAANWRDMQEANIGLALYGSVGTGKTFFAACICNEVIERGGTAYMLSVAEILDRASNFKQDDELMQRIRYWDLLVIDDLGAERDTSYAEEQVYKVIDARYKSGKPMMVTTNLSLDKEAEGIAKSRIMDRVKEMCAVQVPIVGQSRRKGIADSKRKAAMDLLFGRGI